MPLFNNIFRALMLVLAAAGMMAATAVAQDGLYADFSTSKGVFTCKLAYDLAPRTVANFVALATGQRAWLNVATGEVSRKPYYNGQIFHYVVSGHVIQGGSPAGTGTDGPGYTVRDEFNAALRHNKAGILSMANLGPNSSGSLFFVTLAADNTLDDVNSAFGEVTDAAGMAVVNAIGAVPVDVNGKPVTPVSLNSVTIRRVGTGATAFNINGQGLPTVAGSGTTFLRSGSNSLLRFTRALYSDYWLYESPTLSTWTNSRVGLYTATPPTGDLNVTASATGQTKRFYRVPTIAYPGPIYTPASMATGTLSLSFTGGGTFVANFNAAGTAGTHLYNGNVSGTFTTISYLQEAYRGQVYLRPNNVADLLLSVVFTTATSGTFKGTAFTTPRTALSGTFTFSKP